MATMEDFDHLWPWWPEAGMTEAHSTVDWIFTAYNGIEQRSKLRDAPVRAYGLNPLIAPSEWNSAQHVIAHGLGDRWLIPLFAQAEFVSGVSYAAEDTLITADTTDRDYRVGDFVVVWSSAGLCSIGLIESFTASDITLVAGGLTLAVSGDVRIAPAYIGMIREAASSDRDISGYVNLDCKVVVFAAPLLPYLTDITLDDMDLCLFVPEGKTQKLSTKTSAWVCDFDIGAAQWGAKWARAKIDEKTRFTFMDYAEQKSFIGFFHQHGNVVPFLLPSGTSDMVLQSAVDAGETVILVDPGPFKPTRIEETKYILFTFSDGSICLSKIDDVVTTGTESTITLTSGTTNVSTMDAVVSIVRTVRFDGALSLTHEGHQTTASVTVTSSSHEPLVEPGPPE